MRRVLLSAVPAAAAALLLLLSCSPSVPAPTDKAVAERVVASDPLPSWNEGPAKAAIIRFVERVTKEGGADFVPPAERVAVFDNDGCLWSEQPMYFQLAFALDRVKAMAPQHPEWKTKQPYKGILEGDLKPLMSGGTKSLLELVMATHAGMTTDEFDAVVNDWITTAQHPTKHCLYTELAYKPMIEVLDHLRANGIRPFIVSGGGIDFMRPWVERVYGIPKEDVVGSTGEVHFELRDSLPVLVKDPAIDFIDDGPGKPVAIHRHIGRRPMMAFGNSDGDQQMLEYTAAGKGPRFCLLVHHTDSVREWAYDRESHIGKLNTALDEAQQKGWTVVDMRTDWKQVHVRQ